MASVAGLKVRSAAERAYDEREAEGELAAIEAAEAEFNDFIAAWAKRHDGAPDAIGDYLPNFLCDYFHARRSAAEEGGAP